MRILGIDTSSRNLSVAILGEKGEIFEHNINSGRRLSGLIIPTINHILNKKKLSVASLDAFAVGLGPGSFTGLRIGIATIKALSLATAKPIIGISSLDILASSVTSDGYQVCPIVDAKRQKVYSCIYKKKNNHLKKENGYLLIEIKELIKKITDKTIFLGDGVYIFRELIVKKLGKKAIFANNKFWFPQARNLVILAKERFLNKKFDNPDSIAPLYLYPKECQVKKSIK